MWQAYLSGAYTNYVNCKHTSACGNIFDSGELIQGIYTDIVVWYLYMNYLAYVACKGHICSWYIYGSSMVNNSCSVFCFYYANYVNYYVLLCNVESIYTTLEVQWNIYVWCGRHIFSGSYVNNMKFMYASASGCTIDCTESIHSIYLSISIHPSTYQSIYLSMYTNLSMLQ